MRDIPDHEFGDTVPLTDEQLTDKDTNYSPASETEMEVKQSEPATPRDDDIDPDDVDVLPGTGGPDDPGDVDVDPRDTNLPQDPDLSTPGCS